MSRRAALIFVLLGMVAVAVVILESPSRNVIKLPDGGELKLAAVTLGTNHSYGGPGWKNRLLRLLPESFMRKFRSGEARLITYPTNVVFWFEGSAGYDPQFLIRDHTGIEFGGRSAVTAGPRPGGDWWEGVGFSVFPRRDKEIHVRVYAPKGSSEIGVLWGEFAVRNPLWANYPVWTPEPLPATRETDGLTVTLRALIAGVRWSGPIEPVPAIHPADVGVRLVFDIAENSTPTDAWTPFEIETSDATGNQVSERDPLSKSNFENGRYTVHYRWGLWPSESAWKLKVQFARRSGFAAEQLWTVRDLVLTSANPDGSVGRETNLLGGPVQLRGKLLENSWDGRRTLQIEVKHYRDRHRFALVQATDQKGRTLPKGGGGWLPGGGFFHVNPGPDTTSVNLTFALHQTRSVEFLARPIWLRTADDAGKISANAPR